VFLTAVPLLVYGLGWGLGIDVAVAGGDRILRGDWPYRDFWTLYAPGSSAAVALVFALLGRELIAVHAVAAVLNAAACAAFFGLLRTAGLARVAALAASGLLALAVWRPAPPLDSYTVARLLLLIGWQRTLIALRESDARPLLQAGFAFGAAALFKHDVAAYAAFGSALAILLARQPMRQVALARLAAGCASFVVPGCLAVAALGGSDAWRDLVVFPAREFAVVRGEPYPGWLPPLGVFASFGNPRAAFAAANALAEWGQAVLPQLLVIGWAAHAVVRRTIRPEGWLAVSCLPFFWAAAHVQQNTHLFSMGLLSVLLAVELWRREPSRVLRTVLALTTAALVGSFVMSSGLRLVRMQIEQRDSRALDLPGTRGIRLPARKHAVYGPIASLIRSRVPPGEPIHVALARHDAVVIGDSRFYYLADRPAATRYHELHPGIVDREEVQLEMIAALERARVRAVVVWRFGWPDAKLDAILARRRRGLPDIGATRLDGYLRNHFVRIARYGEYDVLWRRTANP